VARLVWYNSILICAVALFVSWLNLKYGSGKWSVFTALIGIAYLIAGMLSVVRNLVHQAELRIREKLLEIELRLTDMDEEMRKGRT
jgi:glycopeptide antibiotics resistance protein